MFSLSFLPISDFTCPHIRGVSERNSPKLQVGGEPEPLVEWLHNGERISGSDPRLRMSLTAGRAALRIPQVTIADEGEYSCRASNSAGSEATKANLTVR